MNAITHWIWFNTLLVDLVLKILIFLILPLNPDEGNSYDSSHHGEHGHSHDKGYKDYNEFNTKEKSKYDKGEDKGFYNGKDGRKKHHYNEGDKYGEHHNKKKGKIIITRRKVVKSYKVQSGTYPVAQDNPSSIPKTSNCQEPNLESRNFPSWL